MWAVGSRLAEGRVLHAQCAEYLIRRDVMEAFVGVAVGSLSPGLASSLQQSQSAQHIRVSKEERIADGAIYVALGSQVDDPGYPALTKESAQEIQIANIPAYKAVIGFIFDIAQVTEIAGVGEFVEIDDMVDRVFFYKKSYHMGTDKTCASGNQYSALSI